MTQFYSDQQVAKKVIDFCLGKYKFIFISGNGGSGKTTLSKQLVEEINSRGLEANCIDTDEFMVDSTIRKTTPKEWIDTQGNRRIGYHTWVFKESYHLNSLEKVIHSLMNGEDCFYVSNKSGESKELKSKFPITIIEGVGAVFLKKEEKMYGIFVMCDSKVEVDRRINRNREG